MGIGIFKSIYRIIKYGKQVGKTANNGARVYKRGGKLTGLDRDGNVISSIHKYKTAQSTTHTVTKTNLPNGWVKISDTARPTNSFGSLDLFKSTKQVDEYGIERTVYGKPDMVRMSGNGECFNVTIGTPILVGNKQMYKSKHFWVIKDDPSFKNYSTRYNYYPIKRKL